jgi:ketosteroid isomerase-like protein
MKHIEDVLKVLFSALTLYVLMVPCYRAAAQDDSEEVQVRALELKLTEAYKVRQFDLLASLLDDEFVITFENGNVYGKTGYISFSATSTIKVDVAEMSEMKVRMHGNVAIVTGLYHERGKDKDGPYDYRDRFTDVWMKTAGRWRLIASHYGIPAKP